MNQILSVEMPQNGKNKSKASLRSIVRVFAVILSLFGIGLVATGSYSYYKNISNNRNSGLQVSTNTKPTITIERTGASTINIVATHDKEISNITYTFNDEEPVETKGNGTNDMEIEVELPIGESTINIIVKDINGISASYQSSFEVVQKPEIKLEQVGTQVQATVTSQINIDTISYYWDDDEENATVRTINDVKTVTLIDVLEGTHTLNITALDIDGNKETKNQKVIGDNKPSLNITTDGKKFIIDASDDENLSSVEIKLNSNQTKKEELDTKEYHTEVDLEDGENKLVVRIYNANGISETKKVKCSKE